MGNWFTRIVDYVEERRVLKFVVDFILHFGMGMLVTGPARVLGFNVVSVMIGSTAYALIHAREQQQGKSSRGVKEIFGDWLAYSLGASTPFIL